MEMTSKEIIYANLEHTNPPRPGMAFNNGRLADFAGCGLGPSAKYEPKKWEEGELEYYDDEWGNVWFRMKDGCRVGEIHQPAISEWSNLETLQMPDFDNPQRYENARETFSQNPDKFKIGHMPGWIFAISRYLRKMEIYFMDLVEYPQEIETLHQKVSDLLEKCIVLFAEAGADGIFYCEDLGTQSGLLIGPQMWRDVFEPHYQRLIGTAHAHGLKVFMHSCGYNWDLLDDLIRCGVDCFQFDQPANYDMPALAEKLKRNKVGLWSPVDIQKVMPTGDKEYIESESRKMVRMFNGGLICGNYGDLPGIGVKPQWDQWAYEAILEEAS